MSQIVTYITYCDISNIILRLADQQLGSYVLFYLLFYLRLSTSLGKETFKDRRFWEEKNSQNLGDSISITSP